jgi:hypothetical protein
MYDPIWVCRDGRRMKLGEMSDAHLYNAIRYVQHYKVRLHWLPRLFLELDIRAIMRKTK